MLEAGTQGAAASRGPAASRSGPGEGERVRRALEQGLARLASLQQADGSWLGDYGGPMFLIPMYVAACWLCRHPIPAERRAGIIRYFRNVQRPDGSIGLHAEGKGCVFTSVLCYVALRLLEVPADDRVAAPLLRWVRGHGGPLGAASWGKLVLALLGLYEYEGLQPILPELWLLPDAAPVHPRRLWCHCRQVYLPMAWLYGRRARGRAEDDLIRALREEIYGQPYTSIPWREHRDTVSPTDQYVAPSALLAGSNRLLSLYEDHHSAALRARALDRLLEHIAYEDRVTHFIRIGPVNAVLNTLVHHFRGAAGREDLERSFLTLDGYLWEGHDGVKMNGYNSCALWDTAFAVQAILATPLRGDHRPALERAHRFIDENQVLEDPPQRERYYREPSRGGWPFSNRAHGWPISDCTAEGLRAALGLERWVEQPLEAERLEAAVRLLLGWQNRDGGWPTYEPQRGGAWLERLNPSQVFGEIMVDYSHAECTASCMQALLAARGRFPGRFDEAIAVALGRGARFLRRRQRSDGSFEGGWGVCFTYGTWFGVAGLLAAGAADLEVERACSFLCAKQGRDGGWGEEGASCPERRYIASEAAHAVNTAWALHALTRGGWAASREAARGAARLLDLQQPDGDWPRQTLCGVFNRTALINYENYRRYFPLWALADYGRARGLF